MILLLGCCDLSYSPLKCSVIIHNYCNSGCQNKINLKQRNSCQNHPMFPLVLQTTLPSYIIDSSIQCYKFTPYDIWTDNFVLLNLDKQMPAGLRTGPAPPWLILICVRFSFIR